jgi:hypothetical protein
LLEADCRRIAITLKLDLLHVDGGVVEDELSRKVVEAWCLWIELNYNNLEGLACYLTHLREDLECTS